MAVSNRPPAKEPWEMGSEDFRLPEACGTVLYMYPGDLGMVILVTDTGRWWFHPNTRTLHEISNTVH